MRKTDALAAFLMLALAAVPWLPPGSVAQWKLQLLLTEMGAWFGGAALVGALVAGVRRRPTFSSLLLAGTFAASAFFFFRPWFQFLAERPAWAEGLARAFGPSPLPIEREAPPATWLTARRPDGSEMKIFFSPGGGPGPHPWVVALHTGGWDAGTPDEFRWFNRRLARRGWAVAAPDYRLAPGHPWPAQRDDVRFAVGWLKIHGRELGLDPSRWALLGRSAGGHIAEAVAYGGRDPSLKGLIAFYAPADLLFAYQYGREDDIVRSPQLLRQLMGGTPVEKSAGYRDASPILQAGPGAPPTLLMHGARDPLTWPAQRRQIGRAHV